MDSDLPSDSSTHNVSVPKISESIAINIAFPSSEDHEARLASIAMRMASEV